MPRDNKIDNLWNKYLMDFIVKQGNGGYVNVDAEIMKNLFVKGLTENGYTEEYATKYWNKY